MKKKKKKKLIARQSVRQTEGVRISRLDTNIINKLKFSGMH